MSAPNTPVGTGRPLSSLTFRVKRSNISRDQAGSPAWEKGGAASLAAVGIQRELRHQQDIGPAIPGGAVELVAAVSFAGEDAQIQQLARHAFKNRTVVEVRAVFVTKAGHDQQALADGAGGQ